MFHILPPRRDDSITLGRVGPFWLQRHSIPNALRRTHMHVIGASGSGKSKFLEHLIASDICAGRGCGLVVIEPDFIPDLLSNLLTQGYFHNPDALENIIYFDPTRTDYVIPFNVLKSPYSPYDTAQLLIEAFRRTWPQTLSEAPRFTDVALNSLMVLITTGQTLIDMPMLLTNKEYRERLLNQIDNYHLVDFFHSRLDHWGREAIIMIESVLNKVNAFALDDHLNLILGAADNYLDFRRIMDEGKVFIVDLSSCNGATRRLIGSLIVTGIEAAAFTRGNNETRRAYYLFIDEFQDFCTDGTVVTYAQFFSQARKFGLYLHISHQNLGQLQERLISALGNVGINVVFRVARSDAEIMAKEIFSVDTSEIKHDAQTDAQHPLYSPLGEQWEQATKAIQKLSPRQAYVKHEGKEAFLMRTEPIKRYQVSKDEVARIVMELALVHGQPVSDLARPTPPVIQERKPIPAIDTNWQGVYTS